ncbi:TetR/AcrR family transcriptional regulator [Paenibacillus guangzhouensis]|uniref:TetR/AcrR family transcriptional regulator n=1 Tax=Paenibacillus guangzhouensis TaxID=1473112 RepID=UPI00126751E8|nr:TetR/AcrR family transcriptional regulator [Paenibacillus guangzhouensis]
MSTAARIQQVALEHFAIHGYSGASLSQIAEDVGIKKPSIYAHFKGKEDLFLHVLDEVLHEEYQALIQYMHDHQQDSLEERLYGVLAYQLKRYEQSEAAKFLLRVSFIPPKNLCDQVSKKIYAHLDQWEQALVQTIQSSCDLGELRGIGADHAASAFLCLSDGLQIELLYSGQERYNRRLKASWKVFWRGISST